MLSSSFTYKLLIKLTILMILVGVSGCGFGASDADGRRCDPGRQVACRCAGDVPGAQVCAEDGASYTACQCTPSLGAAPDLGISQPPTDAAPDAVEEMDMSRDADADADADMSEEPAPDLEDMTELCEPEAASRCDAGELRWVNGCGEVGTVIQRCGMECASESLCSSPRGFCFQEVCPTTCELLAAQLDPWLVIEAAARQNAPHLPQLDLPGGSPFELMLREEADSPGMYGGSFVGFIFSKIAIEGDTPVRFTTREGLELGSIRESLPCGDSSVWSPSEMSEVVIELGPVARTSVNVILSPPDP